MKPKPVGEIIRSEINSSTHIKIIDKPFLLLNLVKINIYFGFNELFTQIHKTVYIVSKYNNQTLCRVLCQYNPLRIKTQNKIVKVK